MAAKVKYPIRAAYARFTPIYNHLTCMADYLDQGGQAEAAIRVRVLMKEIGTLERDIKTRQER